MGPSGMLVAVWWRHEDPQAGRSVHSFEDGSGLREDWEIDDWEPRKDKFPNGLEPIIELAESLEIILGLWYLPSWADDYKKWVQDADILINLYKKYNIKHIKIDGVRLPTMKSDLNLQKLFNKVLEVTNNEVVFIFDVTADNRLGYHYNSHIGKTLREVIFDDFLPEHFFRLVPLFLKSVLELGS